MHCDALDLVTEQNCQPSTQIPTKMPSGCHQIICLSSISQGETSGDESVLKDIHYVMSSLEPFEPLGPWGQWITEPYGTCVRDYRRVSWDPGTDDQVNVELGGLPALGLMLHGTANHAKAKKTRRTRRTRSPKRRKRRKRRSLARSTGHRAVCVCVLRGVSKKSAGQSGFPTCCYAILCQAFTVGALLFSYGSTTIQHNPIIGSICPQ